MTDNELKNWAFLSYSQQDNGGQRPETPGASHRCWGDWLQDALKTFSVPTEFVGQLNGRGEIIPERIAPVFRDAPAPAESATLSAETRRALEQSICLIVICSPRSATSPQVNEAVRYFKQLGRGKNILPIVIAGEPNASDARPPGQTSADECFVPALRHPVLPEGTLDTTRRAGKFIFVDARHSADKREILANDQRSAEADLEMAKIQLIALLLGVGFNGLWWREQKRHFFDFAAAQHQAREALQQVAEVRRQLSVAQQQALELQNLPRDVHGQIQAAQTQALEAQQQLSEVQNKVRDAQTQAEAARDRALAAEGKVLEAQNQARNLQHQLEELRQQASETQDKILEAPPLSPAVSESLQAAQNQVLQAQRETQNTQSQLEVIRQQAEAAHEKLLTAHSELEAARQQTREAQSSLAEIQSQTRAAQSQIDAAQNQVQTSQNQNRQARRLAKIFALLAVLACLAASLAWRQRQLANQALTKAAAAAAGNFEFAAGELNAEQIRQGLQNIGGAEQAANRLRSLDALASRIAPPEISETLKSSAIIVDDQQRRHFQETLLAAWMQTNLPAAFAASCELADADFRQRALEKIIPALSADHLTNALARLNELPTAPGEELYQRLFQRWAALDPVSALQARQQIPNQDADDKMLGIILTTWMAQQPTDAWRWVQSQPESDSKANALQVWIGELSKTNLPQALALAESLPESAARSTMIARLWLQTDPFAACDWLNRLGLSPTINPPATVAWPWTTLRPTTAPVETERLSKATNDPVQIKSPE